MIEVLLQRFVKMPYYAVRIGRSPGIYKTWNECLKEVEQFPKARYKKFNTEAEADVFIKASDPPGQQTNSCPYTGPSSSKKDGAAKKTGADQKLKKAEGDVKILKKKLELAEKKKEFYKTETELDTLKQEYEGKPLKSTATSKKFTSHNASPYKKQETASSANWKQNKKTEMLDIGQVRDISQTSSSAETDDGVTVVYTDGACSMNGRHGAVAGIGVYWGPGHPLNVSERLPGRQTNNRAEIHAVVKAVQQAKQKHLKEIVIKTDSQFLIKSMTQWLPGWQKKGWKTAAGEEVKNREDFEALIQASQGVKINYVHVKGHEGIDGNECADKLAVEGKKKPL